MNYYLAASPNVAKQAAELIQKVEQQLCDKQKDTVQVHLEMSVPEYETEYDAAKLLLVFHPHAVPNIPGYYWYVTTYDVDLAMRVDDNTVRRVQNQYFIKLLASRLGVLPLVNTLGQEQDSAHGCMRQYYSSISFSYEKLLGALQELIRVTSPKHYSLLMSTSEKDSLRQKLLSHFDINLTAAYHGKFAEKLLQLQVREVAGQLRFELVALHKKRTFLLGKAHYEYLTLCKSWHESDCDYEHHHLSQISTERFQAGAQYEIALSELLYVLE